MSLGRPPEVYGAAGVMKFPHGAALHAIQFLPMLAWLLTTLRVPERDRVRAVLYALWAILAFTAFSLLQMFTGRPRFEFWWFSALFLAAAVMLTLVSVGSGMFHSGCVLYDRRRAS